MQLVQSMFYGTHGLASQNGEVESFERADLAIDLIQRAISNRQNIAINGGPTGMLCVFPELGEYLDLLEDSASFFTMPANELYVVELEIVEVSRLIETLNFGRDLNELLM